MFISKHPETSWRVGRSEKLFKTTIYHITYKIVGVCVNTAASLVLGKEERDHFIWLSIVKLGSDLGFWSWIYRFMDILLFGRINLA